MDHPPTVRRPGLSPRPGPRRGGAVSPMLRSVLFAAGRSAGALLPGRPRSRSGGSPRAGRERTAAASAGSSSADFEAGQVGGEATPVASRPGNWGLPPFHHRFCASALEKLLAFFPSSTARAHSASDPRRAPSPDPHSAARLARAGRYQSSHDPSEEGPPCKSAPTKAGRCVPPRRRAKLRVLALVVLEAPRARCSSAGDGGGEVPALPPGCDWWCPFSLPRPRDPGPSRGFPGLLSQRDLGARARRSGFGRGDGALGWGAMPGLRDPPADA